MDSSYNLVAEKCAQQMATYQAKNQTADWPQICKPHSDALAACADTAVPHLAAVKKTCAPKIEAYSQCLKAHAASTDEQVEQACGGVIKALWECSEGVMRDYGK